MPKVTRVRNKWSSKAGQSKDADTDRCRKNGLSRKDKLYSVPKKDSSKYGKMIEFPKEIFPHLMYASDLTRDLMDQAACISESERKPCFLKKTIRNVRIKVILKNSLLAKSVLETQVQSNPKLWPYSPVICVKSEEHLKIKNGVLFMDETQFNETKRMLEQCCINFSTTKAVIIRNELKDVHEALTELLETPIWNFLNKFKQKIQKMDAECLPGTFCMELDILLNTVKHPSSPEEKAVVSTRGKSLEKIPEALTDYLHRKREVRDFFIWKGDQFWVFVKHRGKERYLEENLKRMFSDFFIRYQLNVIVGEVQLHPHLRQGDRIFGKGYGTLGGFVKDKIVPVSVEKLNSGESTLYKREPKATTGEGAENDKEANIYVLTCGHVCKRGSFIYTALENLEQMKIGKCIFSSDLHGTEKISVFTDLALVQIDNNMKDRCELSMLNHEYRESKVRLYREDLESIVGKVFVYKIGAYTGLRKGVIISPEFYKDMTGGRAEMFIVSSINCPFSERGDSGSLVFMNDNSSALDTVKVIGMLWGGGSLNCDVEGAPSMEGKSFCFRIDEALHVLQENGFDVCFENQLT